MNRKMQKLSIVFFFGVLAILLFITLNLHSARYNAESVYAQGITIATPTVEQQTTPKSGSQTNIPLDSTLVGAIIQAVAAVLAALIASIVTIILTRTNNAFGQGVTDRRERHLKRSEQLKLLYGLYTSINHTQIFELDTPLRINDVHIPSKVIFRPFPIAPFPLNTNVTLPDINKLLQEIQAAQQKLFDDAENLCDVLLPGTSLWPNSAPRCLLAGDVGVGKTTQLKHYVLEYVYPKDWSQATNSKGAQPASSTNIADCKLPIYIELKDFAEATLKNKELSLVDFIVQRWKDSFNLKEGVKQYIEDKLAQEKAIFLLDGLEEAFIGKDPSETYSFVIKAIENQGTSYPKIPIIVTTRDSDYQRFKEDDHSHYLKGFSKWELLGFRTSDLEAYITKWSQCQATGLTQADAEHIHRNLEQSLRIQALATHPRLLIYIITHPQIYSDWNVPGQRVGIYKESADLFLRQGNSHRRQYNHVSSLPSTSDSPPADAQNSSLWERKLVVLEKIAWLFHSEGKYYLHEDKVISYLVQTDTSGGTQATFTLLLQEIVQDGLLKKYDRSYYFFCLPLQEYFAAKNARKADADLRRYSRNSKYSSNWWEEVISVYGTLGQRK